MASTRTTYTVFEESEFTEPITVLLPNCVNTDCSREFFGVAVSLKELASDGPIQRTVILLDVTVKTDTAMSEEKESKSSAHDSIIPFHYSQISRRDRGPNA